MKQVIHNICETIVVLAIIGSLLLSCDDTGSRIERMMNPCALQPPIHGDHDGREK